MLGIREKISNNDHFDIVQLLLIDHGNFSKYVKKILNNQAETHERIYWANTLFGAIRKHYSALEKTVFLIIEREVEHELIMTKIESLTNKLGDTFTIDIYTEIEFLILTKLIEQNLRKERDELVRLIKNIFPQNILNEIGFQFAIMRKFNPSELEKFPVLRAELFQEKFSVYSVSKNFIESVNHYISGLVAETGYI